MIRATDLAWAAAVIELKGMMVCKANKMRATPQRVLIVDSRRTEVIGKLSAMTGTKPEEHEREVIREWMQRNCTAHCPEAHTHVHKHMPLTTRWTVTGVSAAIVISNVAPFMTDSRRFLSEVSLVEEDLKTTGPGSGAIFAAVRRLSELGWKTEPWLRSLAYKNAPAPAARSIMLWPPSGSKGGM